MPHSTSADDRQFRDDFEACRVAPAAFDHRAHIRLAYVYLTEGGTEAAATRMRGALLAFLDHHAIDVSKFHETMTRAWILAVRHFMELTPDSACADAFIDANPRMLDSRIMMSHYSVEVLFSADARARFVKPDLEPIPRHEH